MARLMAKKKRGNKAEGVRVVINRGHDRGEKVRHADPDTGEPVMLTVNRTQLMVDRLLDEGLIQRYQWQAAVELREIWLRARPVAEVIALDPSKPGGIRAEAELDPAADKRLRLIVRTCGKPCWIVIERLVYDDMDPREWGARKGIDGLTVTRAALAKLAEAMGLA